MPAIGFIRAACLTIGLLLGLLVVSPAAALAHGASSGTATQATGVITGTATDAATGAPIQNLEVDLSGPTSMETCTAADGTYTFSGLSAGEYHVEFQGSGVYCPRTNYLYQFYDNAQSWASAATIYLTPGSMTRSGIDAAMPPAGQITGTVTDASTHAPLQNIEVEAYTSGGGYGDSTCTGPNGTYTLIGLATGAYTLAFDGNGPDCPKTNYLDQIYNDEPSWASADPVNVTAGSTTSGIDAALGAGGQITGTVTDASTHAPIEFVEVDAYDSSGDQVGSTCTAADGSYAIIGLETGTYHVGFSSGCGANYLSQFYDDEQSLPSADPVKVTAGSTKSNVDAALTQGGEVDGTVTDAGDPVVGMEVDIYNGAFGASTCTGGDGSYSFVGVPTGSYTVSLNDNFYGPCGPILCFETSSQPVSVTAGAPASDADLTTSPCPIQVTGTVTDAATGAPIQGATVTVYDTNGDPLGSSTTDGTGGYQVTIPHGVYTVEVGFTAPRYVSQFYDNEASLQQATPVDIFLTKTDAGGAVDIDAALVKPASPSVTATPSPGSATPASSVSAATTTKPALTHLKETHSVFRGGTRLATFARTQTPVGTTFSFVLDAASTVRFRFVRLVKGRNVDGKCVLATSGEHGPSCNRLVLVAALTYGAGPGSHQLEFDGRISASKKLSPGGYELVLLATNPAGRSPPRRIAFTIIK